MKWEREKGRDKGQNRIRPMKRQGGRSKRDAGVKWIQVLGVLFGRIYSGDGAVVEIRRR